MSMNDMNEAEVKLADEKLRAELVKLIAETRQISVGTFLMPFPAAAGLMGVRPWASNCSSNGKRSSGSLFCVSALSSDASRRVDQQISQAEHSNDGC